MAREFTFDGTGDSPAPGGEFSPTGGTGDGAGATADAFGGTTLDDGPVDPRGGDFIFDPARHISRDKINVNGTFRRRKIRRNGSGGRTASATSSRSKADIQASIDGLSKTLVIIHAGLADTLKAPELKLEDTEGEGLAAAVANVLSEFDITPDPKIQAIVGLVMVAGAIYGPRAYLINERMKATKQNPNRRGGATVSHLRPVPAYTAEDTPIVN